MDKKYLAIFDLDGTLYDTSEVNYYAYQDALASFNVQLEKSFFISECNGKKYTEFLPRIVGNSGYIDEIHDLKKEAYHKNIYKARRNTHLFKMIEVMKQDYFISLVTTASRRNTFEILSFFEDEYLFDYIITQEDVEKVKPDPQGFLKAMSFFKTVADQTIIFEDSASGIKAAQLTGATVIAVKQF